MVNRRVMVLDQVMAADAGKSLVFEDNIRALFYDNALIVLTFKNGTTCQ
jgi:hypothetical protein